MYVTMQIAFLMRKSALIYTSQRAILTLDCNGVFAIKAYTSQSYLYHCRPKSPTTHQLAVVACFNKSSKPPFLYLFSLGVLTNSTDAVIAQRTRMKYSTPFCSSVESAACPSTSRRIPAVDRRKNVATPAPPSDRVP